MPFKLALILEKGMFFKKLAVSFACWFDSCLGGESWLFKFCVF